MTTLTPAFFDISKPLREQGDELLLAGLGWAEARGEIRFVGYAGPLAVMQVALNRARIWNKSLSDIILQSAVVKGRRIWQFSCWSVDDPRTPYREPTDPNYVGLLKMRQKASEPAYLACWLHAVGLLNQLLAYDPSRGATHYYNPSVVSPSWGRGNPKWEETVELGHHVFGRVRT